ncbi:MAG: hypothetical protein EZS28_034806 [Streblomastix strix]|uniref:Uncharacterized protein n=1 Tax=Streblomastix strix TaxID=222440 RepID=A0A5J4UFX3_9EUKA|nr:MAG: hypothetical protein EZS28_034806 [Streblomastix strix]
MAIKGVSAATACLFPLTGGNFVSHRLTALFTQQWVPQPNEKSLIRIFNSVFIGDLSKVFKGIMQIKVIDKKEELQISRLYVFELLLFISVIITNDEDRNIFSQQIVSLAKQYTHINWKYDIMFEKKVVKECPFELEYKQAKDYKAKAGKKKEYDQSKQFSL